MIVNGCGKLSVFFSDRCEVGYPDVVAEGSEVEFSSLGRWLALRSIREAILP